MNVPWQIIVQSILFVLGFMKEDDHGIITPSQVIHMLVDTIV